MNSAVAPAGHVRDGRDLAPAPVGRGKRGVIAIALCVGALHALALVLLGQDTVPVSRNEAVPVHVLEASLITREPLPAAHVAPPAPPAARLAPARRRSIASPPPPRPVIAAHEQQVEPNRPTSPAAVPPSTTSHEPNPMRRPENPAPADTGPNAAAPAPAPSVVATPRRVAHLDCAIVKPGYPPQSLRRGEAGTAIVQLEIDANGSVTAARVVTSSGYARLDAAAREAVLASRCAPYVEHGTPLPAYANVPITFNLEE